MKKKLQIVIGLFEARPWLLYLFVFLMFGVVRLSLLPWNPIGLPDDHDEHSYILQAETFAEGNIANPTPPLWEHFESFHILMTPSYSSKYPPGQSIFLFLGIKLFGHAWYGVLLSCMLMTAAIVWMIHGYKSTKWALTIGIFIVLRFSLWNYWSSSYWGGAVAALGGALLFGALPRLTGEKRMHVAVASACLGLGLAILSQSRPFEGIILSIIPMAYFIHLVFQSARNRQYRMLKYLLVPVSLVMVLNFAFTAYFNFKITGEYLKMPYQLYGEQYGVQALLLVLNNKNEIPEYYHTVLAKHHNGWEVVKINTIKDYLSLKRKHFLRFIRYFYYWPLLIPLTIFFFEKKSIRIPLWSFVLLCAMMMLYPWFAPHYFAPLLSVYYLLLINSINFLIQHNNLLIRRISRVTIPICLLFTFIDSNYFNRKHPNYINGTEKYMVQKQQIIDRLKQTESKHLILVKYSEDHLINEEWVYNEPNLGESQLIWARYMNEQKNQQLKDYYRSRTAWLLEPDPENSGLQKY